MVYLGTATSNVSMYSESWIKFSFVTTSTKERMERFPLYFGRERYYQKRKGRSYVFFRCI